MSWSGFKKNVGRATTQVMMKTGQVEKTSDRSYEVEERRFRTLESASLRLQKEAKGYLDSLRAMTASQMRIAETIDAFYGDSGARDGVSRSYKQAVEDLDAETVKALDGPYRTTVLEPINRFCAYFPDINECIKKRQNKMLDYDALRSRVKKLTEKPDKDPGKLPRTEKEMEMVSSHSSFSSLLRTPARRRSLQARNHPRTYISPGVMDEGEPEIDFTVPSPPKALQRPEIEKLRHSDRPERRNSAKLERSPTKSGRAGGLQSLGLALGAAPDEFVLTRGPSTMTDSISTADFATNPNSSTRFHGNAFRSATESNSPTPSSNLSGHHGSGPRNITTMRHRHGPFFNPSELEEIMQPYRREFAQKQADEMMQAKATYEQLNEQLTTELPQLIDLRVPYLDPSFEALVKIQLRFCAEAYSRMAQVQQYLDASTRDQYASGDLDARVEDVLGQIRELSIAGTV